MKPRSPSVRGKLRSKVASRKSKSRRGKSPPRSIRGQTKARDTKNKRRQPTPFLAFPLV